jgi:transcriptional repressor NrdR
MTCPHCHAPNADVVIDSRTNPRGTLVRRRRACGTCAQRFTTYEIAIPDKAVKLKVRELAARSAA